MNTTSGTNQTTRTIGEFPTVTGLSIKTLRFQHVQGTLIPGAIDGDFPCRYYDANKVEKARFIPRLR